MNNQEISKMIDELQPDALWYIVKVLGTLENVRVGDLIGWNDKECKEFLFDRLVDYAQTLKPKPDYYGKNIRRTIPPCVADNRLMPEILCEGEVL